MPHHDSTHVHVHFDANGAPAECDADCGLRPAERQQQLVPRDADALPDGVPEQRHLPARSFNANADGCPDGDEHEHSGAYRLSDAAPNRAHRHVHAVSHRYLASYQHLHDPAVANAYDFDPGHHVAHLHADRLGYVESLNGSDLDADLDAVFGLWDQPAGPADPNPDLNGSSLPGLRDQPDRRRRWHTDQHAAALGSVLVPAEFADGYASHTLYSHTDADGIFHVYFGLESIRGRRLGRIRPLKRGQCWLWIDYADLRPGPARELGVVLHDGLLGGLDPARYDPSLCAYCYTGLHDHCVAAWAGGGRDCPAPAPTVACLADLSNLVPDEVTPIDELTGLPRWLLLDSDWVVVLGVPCEQPPPPAVTPPVDQPVDVPPEAPAQLPAR